MPIYEFYCKRCNTIYNFFSKSVNTHKIPLCPKCRNVRLARQMSVFATLTGKAEGDAENDPLSGVDPGKMEKAMLQLAAETEKIKDDDPRAAARLMRQLSDAAGIKMGDNFQEALQRLEAGEDPDKIEEEMGDVLSDEYPLVKKQGSKISVLRKPNIDEVLYDL